MSQERFYRFFAIQLILVGIILRLVIFYISPPNNSYDDHLEVIALYANEYGRPDPFQCWECYQPPIYYFIAATVFKISSFLGFEAEILWKTVQAINTLLSILTLFLSYRLLLLLGLHIRIICLILSFIVILPRDLFTSVMIGNDYLLVYLSVLSVYYFFRLNQSDRNNNSSQILLYSLLVGSATIGALTKQHGLLLFILPLTIIFITIFKRSSKYINWLFLIIIVGFLFVFAEEYWKFSHTGEILVSNQHYFDYAKDQFPGSLKNVEFLSFRIIELMKDPFISENTSASILTELFARTFFDYEWRFISPKIPLANNLARVGYVLGLVWLIFFAGILSISVSEYLRKDLNFSNLVLKSTPFLLVTLFFLVPVVQTIRYPYFSSMKSMFMLPGIIIFLILAGKQLRNKSKLMKFFPFLMAINIIYGIALIISIFVYIDISLPHLSGPLWQIP